ncbi:hypothetical protein HK101_000246 [Irineochytrium annulatum]|nr:hypothetical protein HK101_000246 [Irineochytrium annulatum]
MPGRRSNPLALRLPSLLSWPSNVRHPLLSQYIKHIFQPHLVAEPGIRASTTHIWCNVTLHGDAQKIFDHPRYKNRLLDFTHVDVGKCLGRAELRFAECASDSCGTGYYRELFKDVEKSSITRLKYDAASDAMVEHTFEGTSPTVARARTEGTLGALRIYRDRPIQLIINVISNPVLSADVMAQYVAGELREGKQLARVYKGLLGKIG